VYKFGDLKKKIGGILDIENVNKHDFNTFNFSM